MNISSDLELAHAIADEVDTLTLGRFYSNDLRISTKPDLTPVSDADTDAERIIRTMLGTARPDDAIFGEEEGGETQHTHRRWIIDPIDGTKNFIRKVPVWATLIALEEEGDITLGLVSAPALGRRWWAGKNMGAFTGTFNNPTPIHCSSVSHIQDASFSYSSLTGWKDLNLRDSFLQLTDTCWRTRAFGDFFSYMLVAEGAVDIAAEPELNLYDMAALVPIVREAGGTFTSLDGQDGPWGTNALASNTLLHKEALKFLGTSQ
ncbi:MAG: histidinol-phosphatase [Actinomycetaceae bacterium]|nr:histidinol-phosphatase [Actinomycetaceae bacterium]